MGAFCKGDGLPYQTFWHKPNLFHLIVRPKSGKVSGWINWGLTPAEIKWGLTPAEIGYFRTNAYSTSPTIKNSIFTDQAATRPGMSPASPSL